MNLRTLLSRRLGELVTAKGLSQMELAEGTRGVVSQRAISSILAGRVSPNLVSLEALALALGTEPWKLLLPVEVSLEMLVSEELDQWIAMFLQASKRKQRVLLAMVQDETDDAWEDILEAVKPPLVRAYRSPVTAW